MRSLVKIVTLTAVTLMMGQTVARADAKADYLAKCNSSGSAAIAPYCECYYKAIDSTYGIKDYNDMQAGKLSDHAKDPAVGKAYGAAMSACATNAKK